MSLGNDEGAGIPGRHSPCRLQQAPRHVSILVEHRKRGSGSSVLLRKRHGTHHVMAGNDETDNNEMQRASHGRMEARR